MNSIESHKPYVGAFERIPNKLIAGVALNKTLLEGTPDPHLRKFQDTDYLLDKAAFFALGGATKQSEMKLQPPTMHRGFVI